MTYHIASQQGHTFKMKTTRTDKLVAYMALISGLSISAVAVYYSVAGLVSIFAAAVIPIIVMGVALEVSKLIATIWLKLNWQRAPFFIKAYMTTAVAILMIITSMGIFGFLSKAHSDAGLVSGDVQAKIAVYDEKIKTAKENIDANRKALKQMDEAVDQVMGRSQDEKGADKAVALRRGQAKERTRLLSEITAEQKVITQLSEERAPIAAEVRKVEAEVGPIKYIANFIYGDNPDANVLEKAVTWVIIIIVIVFDPLAVILLLASQYSFQWFRKDDAEGDSPVRIQETEQPTVTPTPPVEDFKFLAEYDEAHSESIASNLDPVYPKTADEVDELADAKQQARNAVIGEPAPEKTLAETHPYLFVPFNHFTDTTPIVAKPVEEPVEEPVASITDEPIFKEAVEAGIYNADGTLAIQDMERPGDYVTAPDFAPPGTPGEAWDAPTQSEQQPVASEDKIYEASTKEIAKRKRSRGWFNVTYPSRDDVN
jgi:hypothetical protein